MGSAMSKEHSFLSLSGRSIGLFHGLDLAPHLKDIENIAYSIDVSSI